MERANEPIFAGEAMNADTGRPSAFPRCGENLLLPSVWLDSLCRVLPGACSALLLLREDSGVFAAAAAWPDDDIARAPFAAALEACLYSSTVQQVPIGSDHLAIVFPVVDGDVVLGAVGVKLAASLVEDDAQVLALLSLAVGWLLNAAIRSQSMAKDVALARLQLGVDAYVLIHSHIAPKDAAMALCNWLAERFACIRVSLGMGRGGQTHLLALSHSSWFDDRSQMARAIENALDEALDQRRGLCLPPLAGQKFGVTLAHQDVAKGNALLSVLLASSDGLSCGALLLERSAEQPFTRSEIDCLNYLGETIGPSLLAKYRAFRWLGLRFSLLAQRVRERFKDPDRPALRWGLGAGLLLLAALLFVDSDWRVAADAVIEGKQHRAIVAPYDGFVVRAAAKAGNSVRAGQVMAEFDQRDLLLEQRRWATEEQQHGSRYRDAFSRHERPSAGVALAQMQEAAANRALIDDKLQRAIIRAPFDAIVVTGDLTQKLGSPVQQGEVLFELAPLDAYRVILKVDERDVRAIKVGQSGTLVLAGLTGEKLPFRVKNIATAEPHDGRNVFRVEAELQGVSKRLRPGMEGVGKIHAGERGLLWIWTHKAWDWLGLMAWKWTP